MGNGRCSTPVLKALVLFAPSGNGEFTACNGAVTADVGSVVRRRSNRLLSGGRPSDSNSDYLDVRTSHRRDTEIIFHRFNVNAAYLDNMSNYL